MQKWEYCKLEGVTFFPVKVEMQHRLYLITENGLETLKDFSDLRNKNGEDLHNAMGKAIAQLGNEGWEMVGAGTVGGQTHCLYFKRPKP